MATEIQAERKRKKIERAMDLVRGSSGEPFVTEPNYRIDIMKALNWYNVNAESKAIRKYAQAYATHIQKKEYLYAFSEASDHELRQIGILGRLIMRDQFVSPEHNMVLQAKIDVLLAKYKKVDTVIVADKKVVTVAPTTIQDRIQEAALKHSGEIDERVDEFIKNKSSNFSTKSYLLSNSISGAVSKRIAEYFQPLERELAEAIDEKCEQLVEGYSYFTKTQLKKFYEFVQSIIADCTQQIVSVKSNRVRIRKPVPPTKLVAKLKYMKEFAELGLKSVIPTDIVGASELWVYNTKYRKLSVYKGDLSVKGTTIIGYEIAGTDSKTLRKPEEFFKSTDISKRVLNSAFKAIKSKPSVPNGRINDDCILIGVFK